MNANDGSVVLKVEERCIIASKAQLALASPYFSAMFHADFSERRRREVTLHGLSGSAVEELVAFSTGDEGLRPSEENAYALLQAAGMLQLDQARNIVCKFLKTILANHNALKIFHHCELYNETDLATSALHHVLWNFEESLQSSYLVNLNLRQLTVILDSPKANVAAGELVVFEVIKRWCAENETGDEEDLESLLACVRLSALQAAEVRVLLEDDFFRHRQTLRDRLCCRARAAAAGPWSPSSKQPACRRVPVYPCVVGRMANNSVAHVLRFDPDRRQVASLFPVVHDVVCSSSASSSASSSNPVGYQVCALGPDAFVTGGEHSLGRSNWSKKVWRYDGLRNQWDEVLTLDSPRRHHGVCVKDNALVVVGGYGAFRVTLDTVQMIDLSSHEVRDAVSLPRPLYSPALCLFRGRLLVFSGEVLCLSPSGLSWDVVRGVQLPSTVNFTAAVASGGCIYLVAKHSTSLYRVDLDAEVSAILSLEVVGHFRLEAQNICVVSDVIFSFATGDGDTSIVETFDTRNNEFKVVWEQQSGEFDFSPLYSFGCFALVVY